MNRPQSILSSVDGFVGLPTVFVITGLLGTCWYPSPDTWGQSFAD